MSKFTIFKVISLLIILLFTSFLSLSCKGDSEIVSITDPVTPGTQITLMVTSPQSGDTLEVASSFEIKWTSNTETTLKIEYSTDNGGTWTTITGSASNTGSYLWYPIPNKLTSEGKIRITTTDNLATDESDGFFYIVKSKAKSLTLTKPTGGEVLFVGRSYNIEWLSNGIENIKIEFSTNGGTNWNVIIPSYPADSGYYKWTPIPNSPSLECHVKISDVSSDTIFSSNSIPFAISIPQDIRVTSPNGGETWEGGSSQTITWYSSLVATVKIEYTIDNGLTWILIANNIPSTGYYTWDPVPKTPSTNAKIRISDASDGYPSDASDDVFTIEPEQALNLISPNGGESWMSGSSQYIRWSTGSSGGNTKSIPARIEPSRKPSVLKSSSDETSGAISDIKIEYSTNSGSSWTTIVERTPNNGSYVWTPVPSHNSALCRVRISDADDGVPFDISSDNFTIYTDIPQQITVVTPNGGEIWGAGSSQTITWMSSGIASVKIEYTINNGNSWNTITENTPSTGFYTWNPLPNTASTNCKVKISDASDGFPSDESNGTFTISPEPAIVVLSPNGGESWSAGTSNNITWNSENVANVKIEFTSNNGATWSTIIESTPSSGVYTWVNIPNLNSTLCKVRVSDAADGVPSDVSDGNFSISTGVKQIRITSPNGGEEWEAGTQKQITWLSTNISKVKLEYSINNGVSWLTIADNIDNTGLYYWEPIPNTPSTLCKVKISDAEAGSPFTDESDDVFTILPEPKIEVLQPAGGEVWYGGSSEEIKWYSENIADVRIDYTTNNGASWKNITETSASIGSYMWSPIPNDSSYLCAIRIYDADDQQPYHISPVFTIIPGEQSIQVVSPNGDEVWTAGSNQFIRWASFNVENVKIEFTTNNGVSWNLITNSVPSSGVYNWASIPAIPSANCKVRISDAADGYPSDVSDATFSIVLQSALTVLSPNGGESWTSGTSQNITWTSTNVSDVKIELSTNNGANWTTIAENTPSDGLFEWVVPSVSSSLCRIRITDRGESQVSDISDDNFTINQTLQGIVVTSPNGGEAWESGTSQNITWNSSGVANVKIEYTINNGVNWNVITNSTPSNGFYIWNPIPNTPSTNCRVRITDIANSYTDQSDELFTIAPEPSIVVTSPNGGEVWLAGTTQIIKWTSENVENVKIEFTSNGGASWTLVEQSAASTGSYSWTVPSINSELCKVRISDALDGAPSDLSDGYFAISTEAVQNITVTSPNGGEVWESGTSRNITWTSTGITNVKIEFTTNNGVSWSTLTASVPSSGFYIWNQIPNTPSTNCKVRISDAANNNIFDESNDVFTIAPEPSIVVTSPNGGEIWLAGTTQTIKWTSENVENVKIEFTSNGGANWTLVEQSAASTGSYSWTVPSINSELCKVRISDALDGAPSDLSDGYFTISTEAVQSITVTSPNGGEVWESGTSRNITWTSTGITNVKIEFTTNNGVSWSTLTASVPSSGFYIWNQIPNTPSTNCKVRISYAVNSNLFDESDGVFTIAPEPSIVVTSPNGGEIWLEGTTQNITWTSENVPFVKIEFTTNGGADWSTIIQSTESIGAYSWLVPTTNSNLCRIRISDALDGAPSDVSDAFFTITNQAVQSVTILAPNGGETWESGTAQYITWTATGMTQVKIELTTNNGLSWSLIENNVENSGAYEWNPVPNLNSTQCKIRVSDAVDGEPVDESNAIFSIRPAQSLQVVYPNGGEVIIAGEPVTILWTSTGIEKVKIEYTVNNGLLPEDWFILVESAPSTGYYETGFSLPSSQYRIRISDAEDGSPSDQSNGTFTVAPQPPPKSIAVISPNGGENWLVDNTYEINWTSNNVENVKIEYTTNGGFSWNLIVNSTASDGIFEQWTPRIQSDSSDICRVRITDVTDPSIYDESDGFFSIHKGRLLRLTFPNGGEKIFGDTVITWISVGIAEVGLRYTLSNGMDNWPLITPRTKSTGAYHWTPPDEISSLARIMVFDADDPTFSDQSDSFFDLNHNALSLITPGGDRANIARGSDFAINWAASKDIKAVTIEYSVDDGKTWNLIAENVKSEPGRDNSFIWQKVQVQEGPIRLRITDPLSKTVTSSGKLRVIN